jgi:ABC-type antimicrobial peptide transport system permease subunit
MLGTFWIRSNARRGEIGLMRSMGATEKKVTKQFLIEAALIVTLGFAFSLALVVNFVFMAEGMSQPSVTGELQYAIVNQWLSPGVQFIMVSLITYLALLVIALVGTLIPVRRAVKVLPADALRDE